VNKYSYTDGGHTFERVSKAVARRAYNNGLRVVFCPVNLRPGEPWHPEVSIQGHSFRFGSTFQVALNEFEYYNLRGRETGRYTAFYLPLREVDRFTGEAPTPYTLGTVKEYDYSYLDQFEGGREA
jgi:hypothetical protein